MASSSIESSERQASCTDVGQKRQPHQNRVNTAVTSKMLSVLFTYSPSAATIEPMTEESSSLVMAKLFLPASFSDAPTR